MVKLYIHKEYIKNLDQIFTTVPIFFFKNIIGVKKKYLSSSKQSDKTLNMLEK